MRPLLFPSRWLNIIKRVTFLGTPFCTYLRAPKPTTQRTESLSYPQNYSSSLVSRGWNWRWGDEKRRKTSDIFGNEGARLASMASWKILERCEYFQARGPQRKRVSSLVISFRRAVVNVSYTCVCTYAKTCVQDVTMFHTNIIRCDA